MSIVPKPKKRDTVDTHLKATIAINNAAQIFEFNKLLTSLEGDYISRKKSEGLKTTLSEIQDLLEGSALKFYNKFTK